MKLAVLLVLLSGCRSASDPPDPASFGPIDEKPPADPRSIVFHNESVEMVDLEVFAPATASPSCRAEAPHRLLCPADYRHVFNDKVYPRTQIKVGYPAGLKMECAQVWVRARSKIMGPDEYREAIFLLREKDSGLVLELGEGQAARLEQRDAEARNKFPAPVRFCPASPDVEPTPPTGPRLPAEVTRVLQASSAALQACCKGSPCRGVLNTKLFVRRDGTVMPPTGVELKGQGPKECLVQALVQLHFSGFTVKPTQAEITLRLPVR